MTHTNGARGPHGAFLPPEGTPAMAPPQFGTQPNSKPRVDFAAHVALALGIVAMLLLLLPSWAYLAGGVLGIGAVVLGAMRLPGASRGAAIIGLIAGFVALAIAVATAVLVYLV